MASETFQSETDISFEWNISHNSALNFMKIFVVGIIAALVLKSYILSNIFVKFIDTAGFLKGYSVRYSYDSDILCAKVPKVRREVSLLALSIRYLIDLVDWYCVNR